MSLVFFYICACSVVSDSWWPMDCSLSDSSVHGIFQARIPEWVAISYSMGSSWPRGCTCLLCLLHWWVASLPPCHLGSPPICGKMQKSGLIEIVPLISTLALQGQHPLLSHPECPQGALLRQLQGRKGQPICLHHEFPQSSPLGVTVVVGEWMPWWLQHPLFPDVAGSHIFVFSCHSFLMLILWMVFLT